MNGSSIETTKHAIEAFESQITLLNINFMPFKISVVLSKLTYRLQVASVPVTTLRKIYAELRKLTKRKCALPMSTPDNLLYDKIYGFGLNSIENILPAQLISNTMSMLRSLGTIGSFLRGVELFYTEHLKTPLSIFAAPLPYGAIINLLSQYRV
jgi:hypothetical protein